MAVLIVAILAGLVSDSAEAKEFNWFENTDQQIILVGRDNSVTLLIGQIETKLFEFSYTAF